MRYGFTLAELLIALAILGVIATFTIPKVLQSQQDGKFKAIAKETAATISGAFDAYKLDKGLAPTISGDSLTPYMNYVAVDSTTTIDLFQTNTTRACNGGYSCLRLHNGGMILYATGGAFVGTASTNAIYFYFDPDGKVTDSTTNGPGKSVVFWLYYNGRLTTYANLDPATVNGVGGPVSPDPTYDPPWFSWN